MLVLGIQRFESQKIEEKTLKNYKICVVQHGSNQNYKTTGLAKNKFLISCVCPNYKQEQFKVKQSTKGKILHIREFRVPISILVKWQCM